MYRYIAVFWNSSSDPAAGQAKQVTERIETSIPGMACALKAAGAAIYYQSDDPGFFECSRTGSLVILGKIFTKRFGTDDIPERAVLDAAAATAACSSQGRTIVQRYWGRYVAVGCDTRTQHWFALRDPTADVPCYMTVAEHVTVLFSNMEDCLKLQLRKFSISWQYLAESLLFPFRDTRQTGLQEVTALEAGEAVTIENGKPAARQCHWDVVMAAAEEPITDLNEAVRLARSTLLGCIGALASQHTHIQLRLSGGLDSSIVLAGLLHAPSKPEVECVHHYDSGIGSDERAYARIAVAGACQSSGRKCELREYERTPDCSLEELLEMPRTARPAHGSGYLLNRSIGPGSAASGGSAQFTGMGGDAVFLRFKGNAGAIDYAWRHGIDLELLRVAFESAQSGDSFYGALKDAIRHGVLKKPIELNQAWGQPCDWVRVGARHADMKPAWMRHALARGHVVSPNKLAHIGRMIFPLSILDPFEGTGSWHGISPISAQPVVELFARIPIYVLTADAEDRTIARRAFEGLLPEALLSRKVKCYLDNHSVAVTQHHREFIRSMLVDGMLAKHGFIDSAAADAGIRRVSPDNSSQVLGIFGPQINIETWLRRWSGRQDGFEIAA
jgi:asparagine synthase (glutamine-hydrolysing)